MAVPATAPETNGRRNLAAAAYEIIYQKIITLAFEPGRHLEEGMLVDLLSIGRTPIREALFRLSDDLLVESMPGKGFVVRPLTLQNTKSAFAALQIYEMGVAGLALRQDTGPFLALMTEANNRVRASIEKMDILDLVEANSAFHDAFARCSHNIYLIQGLRKVRCETNRLAYLSYGNEIDPVRTLKVHYASVIEQHQAIIDAVAGRDEDRLKQIILEHMAIFKNRVISYLMSN
jgi:DNA-binding GntR family transcriptional regulator